MAARSPSPFVLPAQCTTMSTPDSAPSTPSPVSSWPGTYSTPSAGSWSCRLSTRTGAPVARSRRHDQAAEGAGAAGDQNGCGHGSPPVRGHIGAVARVYCYDPPTTEERDRWTSATWLAERFEEHRAHLRAVAYRMLGSLSEADDAVQEAWLRLEPRRHRRGREPGRLADHGRRPGVPEHAAHPRGPAARSRSRCTCPTRSSTPEAGGRPGAGGAAGRLGRAGAAGGAGHADPGRAARVRAARHVRRAVRRDRPDPRAARRPRPGSWPAGPGGGCRARAPVPDADLGPPAGGRRRVLRRGPRRRLRRAGRRARPGRGAAGRRRRGPDPARRSCCAARRTVAEKASTAPKLGPVRPPGAGQRRGRRGRHGQRAAVRR